MEEIKAAIDVGDYAKVATSLDQKELEARAKDLGNTVIFLILMIVASILVAFHREAVAFSNHSERSCPFSCSHSTGSPLFS